MGLRQHGRAPTGPSNTAIRPTHVDGCNTHVTLGDMDCFSCFRPRRKVQGRGTTGAPHGWGAKSPPSDAPPSSHDLMDTEADWVTRNGCGRRGRRKVNMLRPDTTAARLKRPFAEARLTMIGDHGAPKPMPPTASPPASSWPGHLGARHANYGTLAKILRDHESLHPLRDLLQRPDKGLVG